MIKLKDVSNIDREHFKSPFTYFVIESVIEGNTLAEAYANREAKPDITIVWDKKHNIYCGGMADKDVLQDAVCFIKEEILTEAVRKNSGVVKVMYENDAWKQALLEGMQELEHNIYPRSIYKHSLNHIPSLSCQDSTVEIRRIDKELMQCTEMNHMNGLLAELEEMWGSADHYLAKGYGFCALKGDSLAAWCTGEYFSKKWCGIGIETYEEFQRQGIAAAMTEHFVRYCLEQGKLPHWDCWKNNIPSVKTAEKAGFEKLADYDILFFRFL